MKRRSTRTSKLAASTVAGIEDLLIEILLRLPVKTLLKFKCVSKQWNSLISSSYFSISHTRLRCTYSTPAALLLNKGSTRFYVIYLNSFTRGNFAHFFEFFKGSQLQILQSCNGLLLCRSSMLKDHNLIGGFVYFVCNPTTKQSKRICYPVSLEQKFKTRYLMSVSLAFDPKMSPHYKIVFIFELRKNKETHVVETYVYSSKNDSWVSRREDVTELCMNLVPPPTLGIGFRDGVYANAAIHWSRYNGRSSSLLCFNVDTFTFKKICFPAELKVRYFGESRGHLYVLAYNDMYHGLDYDVLEIAADYSGWFVMYHVNLLSLRRTFPELGLQFSILSIAPTNNEDLVIVISMLGRVLTYNLSNGKFKSIFNLGHWLPGQSSHTLDYEGYSYQYFECLLCV
ncbi:F-box protein At5g07610 [Ricinus communis]|uniref:F-box domain-containing protein n=1 Tax=Ricinus communis TaxID=3988 RepID=B9S3S7_RICCO|nr:F-box protein At5g07610 [Ricinus communis]EEF41742.1 conserved hypothetical protein [Ricinus communis]|eukprot:XP_002520646.1 F-box protein At5g07610 [Ricinus communis]